MLFHSPPSLNNLKTFGCACFPLLTPYTAHKLQPRSSKCIFLRYPPSSKGYICFDPNTQKVYITPHVLFHESNFPILPTSPSDSSVHISSVKPSLDLWISTLLPGSSISPLFVVSATLPTIFSPLSKYNEGYTVPTATPTNVTSPPFDIMPSSGPIESSSSNISTSIVLSTLVVPSAPHSLPNTHPMLSKSKHGIFKPKTYATVRNYVQEEPPTQYSSVVPSAPHSLPNTHPMLSRSKHGIFKPKAYAIVRNYVQEEPPTFHIASRFPH